MQHYEFVPSGEPTVSPTPTRFAGNTRDERRFHERRPQSCVCLLGRRYPNGQCKAGCYCVACLVAVAIPLLLATHLRGRVTNSAQPAGPASD